MAPQKEVQELQAWCLGNYFCELFASYPVTCELLIQPFMHRKNPGLLYGSEFVVGTYL